MATKTPGGKITGNVAITCEAQVALAVGDFVHITGPYEVALADGTKPVIGYVSVKNVTRVAGAYPVALTPGDVTIEALGTGVVKKNSGGAIAAGARCGIGAAGALLAAGGGVSNIGVALTPATGAAQAMDVLLGVA